MADDGSMDSDGPIDVLLLDTYLGEDWQILLGELLPIYEQDGAQRIEEIERACQGQDAEGLERAAHALKSQSLSLGAVRIGEIARVLEENGRAANLSAIADERAALGARFQEAVVALRLLCEQTN